MTSNDTARETKALEINVMAWMFLIVAGLLEVAWASLLDATKGFTKPAPTAGFLATLAASMYLLSLATRTIPISIGYAIWVGIGLVGTLAVGILVEGDQPSANQIAAVAALAASIAAVKLTAS